MVPFKINCIYTKFILSLQTLAALLPMILCLATAARINSYSRSILKPSRNYYDYEDFMLNSFGSGKHFDAVKTTRSSNDFSSKQPAQLSNGLGKSVQNQLPENDMDGGKGNAEPAGRGGEELGAPAYGSIGTVGVGSSGRNFGGSPAGHQGGGFVAPAFGSVSATAFSKSNGGFAGHGAQPSHQGGSFGGQAAGFHGGQSGSFGGHQGGSSGVQSAGFHGGQSGSFGNQGGSYGAGQGGASGYGGGSQGYGGQAAVSVTILFYNTDLTNGH